MQPRWQSRQQEVSFRIGHSPKRGALHEDIGVTHWLTCGVQYTALDRSALWKDTE
jgi:hypothetical protein